MRFAGLIMATIVVIALMIMEPALATGLGMSGPAGTWNSAEAYCLNHGGFPQAGKCYFPDGGYCDIGAFYNGSCPSRADREQAMWDAEMYAWLNSDYDYGTATYWFNEANRLYLAGSYEQAAIIYTRAVNINPSLPVAWLNLGNSLYFLGRYQESLDAFEAALSQNPQDANAWQGKGLDLMALNRTYAANDALRKAMELRKLRTGPD